MAYVTRRLFFLILTPVLCNCVHWFDPDVDTHTHTHTHTHTQTHTHTDAQINFQIYLVVRL